MSIRYVFNSLEEMATMFDAYSQKAENNSSNYSLSLKDQREWEGRASAYKMCARIIRNAEIVPQQDAETKPE